jgi:energy-coupling factor transporter ATP-binding protein EcfA2
MNIAIKHLKNIDKLDIDIEDKKINFIFGISGSGKSAIADALTKAEMDDLIQVGKQFEDLHILVDGKERNLSNFAIFDEKQIEKLDLYSEEGEDAYEIIFSNNGKYIETVKEFENIVSKLNDKKSQLMNKQFVIRKLLDGQSIKKLTRKGELPKTANVMKIMDIHSKTNSTTLNKAVEYGQDKVSWIKKGVTFDDYNKKICSFCEQSLKDDRITEINDILSIDNKFFKVIEEDESVYNDLNIPKPDYFSVDSLKNHSKTMIDYANILDDILKINSFLELADIDNTEPKELSKIKLSNAFKKSFPDIYAIVEETNANLESIKRQLSIIKYQMKNSINQTLKVLGIKYRLVERPIKPREKKASFLLKHISETKEEVNQVSYLSTGEKNIIALIFFLLKNKRKNIIIDDPASSFDEYRRKIIFNYIKKNHNKRTILVLSHDEVFSKFAIKAKYKEKNKNIGIVNFMSNYSGKPFVTDINPDDYKSFEEFVKTRIKLTDNYLSKIVNCRLLYEIECQNSEETNIQYGYLSAIIHGSGAEQIKEFLKKNNFEEKDLLDEINQKWSVKLPMYSKNEIEDAEITELTNFEKIFYLRETIKEKKLRDEMSDLIHLNDKLAICLNPYKFDTFSPYLFDCITQMDVL